MLLRYVNQANDRNVLTLVLFQKLDNMDDDVTLFAWQAIKHCGSVDNVTLTYNSDFEICVADADGNFTPMLNAAPGNDFTVTTDARGFLRLLPGESTPHQEIKVQNQLTRGVVDAYIYQSRKQLLKRGPILPGQEAVFSFNPTLYATLLPDVDKGDIIPVEAIAKATTFSLLGLQGADIVLRGGGRGRDATPYTITLENLIL